MFPLRQANQTCWWSANNYHWATLYSNCTCTPLIVTRMACEILFRLLCA